MNFKEELAKFIQSPEGLSFSGGRAGVVIFFLGKYYPVRLQSIGTAVDTTQEGPSVREHSLCVYFGEYT
jgi:hypothetical protein